jgi:hypothetical protein
MRRTRFIKLFKKYIYIVFLLGLIIPAIYPLLMPGFYPMHDNQHVARLHELDIAFRSGQFPVRWVKNLGFGYGYPLFNFYPPLLYYLAEVFYIFGASYLWSIKIIFITSFILAAFLMYIFAKDFLNKWGAFLTAAFYIYLPYRAVDCYVRGALAELLALSWLPGLLWAGGRIFYLKKVSFKHTFYLALLIALLMTTHNLTMLIFAPFFIMWSGFFWLKNKHHKKWTRLKTFITGIFLGAAYSCFFWLPALWEKKYTLVDKILLKNLYDYQHHFVYLDQLWDSPFGYGGSLPGRIFDDISGMSFEIGKIHLVAAFLVLTVLIFKLFKKDKFQKKSVLACLFILLLFSIFMSITISQTFWSFLRPIQYIQFPWRFLGIVGLFVSLIAGFVVKLCHKKIKIGCFSLFLILVVFTNKNYFKPIRLDTSLKDSDYISQEAVKWEISRSSFEYLPAGIPLEETREGLEFKPPIEKSNIAKTSLSLINGKADIEIIKEDPHRLVFKTSSEDNILIQANIFSFPGWQFYLNNIKTDYKENSIKLITLSIPGGDNLAKLVFKNTLIRKLANGISLASILGTLLYFSFKQFFIKFKIRKNQKEN